MAARVIRWRGDVWRFDKYKLHEIFLWGAKAALFPGSAHPPLHPTLADEFWQGHAIGAAGYVRMTKDFDATQFVRQLKREHELRRKALAEKAA